VKRDPARTPTAQRAAGIIRCSAELLRPAADARAGAADWTFLRLPKDASDALPSRGKVSVRGVFHGFPFAATLNPDGEGGHWLRVEHDLSAAAGVGPRDAVDLEFAPVVRGEEPEPQVPPDLRTALDAASPRAREAWSDITPAARRDFVHWVTSPKRPETRATRIAAACDMLAKGKRRPCCFDRSGAFDGSQSCPVAEAPESARRRP
jgi:hypothetical protein